MTAGGLVGRLRPDQSPQAVILLFPPLVTVMDGRRPVIFDSGHLSGISPLNGGNNDEGADAASVNDTSRRLKWKSLA
jgi:hypothetical protein